MLSLSLNFYNSSVLHPARPRLGIGQLCLVPDPAPAGGGQLIFLCRELRKRTTSNLETSDLAQSTVMLADSVDFPDPAGPVTKLVSDLGMLWRSSSDENSDLSSPILRAF